MLKAGIETGRCAVGHTNFQLQNDSKTKVFVGVFTYYFGAMVTNPLNVLLCWDVYVNGRLGGMSRGFVNEHNRSGYSPDEYMYVPDASCICTVGPYEEELLLDPMYISGDFSYYAYPGFMDRSDLDRHHYAMAGYYNELFEFRHPGTKGTIPVKNTYHPHAEGSNPAHIRNTMCYKGSVWYYNRVKKDFSHYEVGTGHFGPYVGPGFKDCREGKNVSWKVPNYGGTAAF